MSFRDHFSARAALYAEFRPDYPEALFAHLAGLPASRRTAFDCATGNGQAAIGLARYFERVVAADASQSQLAHAGRGSTVAYVAASAEHLPVRTGSADLLTVAQALHWLDLEPFYAEVHRVLATGGAIAVWGYGDPVLDDARVQGIVHEYNRGTIEEYWLPERRILLDGYVTIPFPFRETAPPSFTLTRDWTLAEFCGYLRTWSGTAAYAAAHGVDPVITVEVELARIWGPPEIRRTLQWPLFLRVGYA